MKYLLMMAGVLLMVSGCASPKDPMVKDAEAYVAKPDYEHAMVCDTRYEDLQKCEATLKQLCGSRGFLDLRIRPLREPGGSVDSSTHRLLQLQCKPRTS